MLFRSIRWRLQLWYGLILVLVLAGFGITAYQLQRGRLFRKIDQELQRRTGELASALRAPLSRQRGLPGQGPGEPPLDRRPPRPDQPMPDGPPMDDAMEGGPPGRPQEFPRRWAEFGLPPRLAILFDEADTNGFYYVMWARDNRQLSRSTNAPIEVPLPVRAEALGPQPARMRGSFREVYHFLPPGETILAGRSIAPELYELHRTAAWLTAIGVVILALGLAGGWWNASRALHPIEDISAAATKIAAGDLSQRISVADTQNELGRLATVLNSTFARLQGAFDEQKQFTSDAAHELRTPISVMLTQTQTALGRDRSAPEYRETVEACQRAAQRMRRLIESLLELARLDAGQEPMKQFRFDLSQVARECVESIRPLADEYKVTLHSDLPAVECLGDPERLAQVITNLLTNAIYYNRPGGEVRLATRTQDGSVFFSVTDTGPGISPEDLPHLFERFYRADKSRTAGRSGLGLAISKAIIEAHGGAIEVASPPGAGATFTIRLSAPGT
jgi:signal transduction histidine kinase